jgi:hypothetical protein
MVCQVVFSERKRRLGVVASVYTFGEMLSRFAHAMMTEVDL